MKGNEEEQTYQCGMIFEERKSGGWYILSQVGNRVFVLINLSDGNRFTEPVEAIRPQENAKRVYQDTLIKLLGATDKGYLWRHVPNEEARGIDD